MPENNNIFLKWIWRLITIIAVTSWIVLLLSAFADRISPHTNPYIPFLGLFFPFILAFNVAFLAFWIIFRKWKHTLLSFIVLLLCWGSVRTYFPFHHDHPNLPENCIKVLTYNVMSFNHQTKHTPENPCPILEYIIEQDPDIICLQEYATMWGLSEETIRKALKATPHFWFCPIDLAIFSKYPILSTKKIPLEGQFSSLCMVELDINGRKTTLFNMHLESNRITADERAEYYDLTKEFDKERWETFTYQMYQRLNPAFQARAKQAELIAQLIRETPNESIIVCGDFNDTPISYTRRTIKGNLKDAFVESGSGMGISFNRHRFYFRIDYILHSKNMKAHNCTVGKLKTSDHYPVWTYLELGEE